MNEESYQFNRVEDRIIFEFDSISEEKTIRKLIEFRLINKDISLYNLALVDVDADGLASDLSISNNKDMPKVLSTVFRSIVIFFDKNPHSKIFIQGSTKSRTRLYQMAITKYLRELEQKFQFFGFIGDELEHFDKGKNFDSFIITLK